MRVSEMDDAPPPPYNEVVNGPNSSQTGQVSLHGSYTRSSLPMNMPFEDSHSRSADTYIQNRSHPDLGLYLNMIQHSIVFGPETTRDSIAFPLPIETYISRDVTSLDWSVFVKNLVPVNDEALNEELQQENEAKGHFFVGELSCEEKERTRAIMAKWNENFFSPRLIHINVEFAQLSSTDRASTSPRMFQSAQSPVHLGNHPVQRPSNTPVPQPLHILSSISSSSSSSSASSSSVDSIKSKDFEGATIGQIRSALLVFQLDPFKKRHLRLPVRQLRDEFRSQRRDLSGRERKDLKKLYKEQRKEVKKEVKIVVEEVKASRRADRKLRKAERKGQREGKTAVHRGDSRIGSAQENGHRGEESATDRFPCAQDLAGEAKKRAKETTSKAHEIAREARTRQAKTVSDAQERAASASARARRWEGEGAARERA